RHGRNRISPLTTLDVWFLGGAVRRIAPEDTAFRQRQTHSMIAIESNWDDPAADRANIEWTRNVARDLEPFSKSGVYLNFGGSADEAQEMLAATSGGNYERLLEVKHRYDPDNLFG
ncbi:MAG: BBE domain-containing protein, partial [Spirochaetota bacterium]